jgi:hypothetical protein
LASAIPASGWFKDAFSLLGDASSISIVFYRYCKTAKNEAQPVFGFAEKRQKE